MCPAAQLISRSRSCTNSSRMETCKDMLHNPRRSADRWNGLTLSELLAPRSRKTQGRRPHVPSSISLCQRARSCPTRRHEHPLKGKQPTLPGQRNRFKNVPTGGRSEQRSERLAAGRAPSMCPTDSRQPEKCTFFRSPHFFRSASGSRPAIPVAHSPKEAARAGSPLPACQGERFPDEGGAPCSSR